MERTANRPQKAMAQQMYTTEEHQGRGPVDEVAGVEPHAVRRATHHTAGGRFGVGNWLGSRLENGGCVVFEVGWTVLTGFEREVRFYCCVLLWWSGGVVWYDEPEYMWPVV